MTITLIDHRWPIFGHGRLSLLGLTSILIIFGFFYLPNAEATLEGPSSGLVGYWTFDEGVGQTVYDNSGSNNTGNISGSPTWTSGQIQGALRINSGADYISIPQPTALTANDRMTVSAWVNLTASGGLIAIRDGVVGWGYALTAGKFNPGEFEFCTYASGSSAYVCAHSPNTGYLNQWAHVVGTYDGTNLNLFVDGTLKNSAAISGLSPTSSYPLFVGGYSMSGQNISGTIDELRIYNRAVSPSEVSGLYNQGLARSEGTNPSTVGISILSLGSGVGTVTSVPSGINCGSTCSQLVIAGNPVTLMVTPSYDSLFTGWVGGGCGINLSCSLTPTANTVLKVSFDPAPPFTGADVYIAQKLQGIGDGSSCDNAKSIDWLNATHGFGTPSNWANPKVSGKVGPGETVHLCGTINNVLVISTNGSNGNPITIQFESGSKLSRYAWDGPWSAISAGSYDTRDWITIDGQNYGVIESTDNGTDLDYQLDSNAIVLSGSHITVKNLIIRNMYARRRNSTDSNRFGQAISLSGSDNLIEHNDASGGDSLIGGGFAGNDANFTIDGNTITECNHCISAGVGGTGHSNALISNVVISNNYIDGMDDWECSEDSTLPGYAACKGGVHRNGIIFINETPDFTGMVQGLYIYGNRINQGKAPLSTTAGTAGIFLDGYTSTQYQNIFIFNNIFTLVPPLIYGNGFIAASDTKNMLVANNSFIGATGLSLGGDNLQFKNNVRVRPGLQVDLADGNDSHLFIPQDPDYNLYFGDERNAFGCRARNGVQDPRAGSYGSLSEWQTRTGWDLHSKNSDPLLVNMNPLNVDPHLTMNSPAIGMGVNLSNNCATVPLLCQDMAGNPRSSVLTDNWTVGAFNYIPTQDLDIRSVIRVDSNYGYDSLLVGLDGSPSYRKDGGPISNYIWSFDDGTSGSGAIVSHRFHSGVHVASLTVTAPGLSDTSLTQIRVIPAAVPDLALYIPFDDSSVDMSGKNVPGTWNGPETYVVGKICKAVALNAVSRFNLTSEFDVAKFLDGFKEVTLALWAKKNDPQTSNSVIYHGGVYALHLSSAGFDASLTGIGSLSVSQGSADTHWHHYAMTYDGAVSSLYEDGIQVASQTMSGPIGESAYVPVVIGGEPFGLTTTEQYFDGQVDDVRIYSRALSPTEIQGLYAWAQANPNLCLTSVPTPTPTPAPTPTPSVPGAVDSDPKFLPFKNTFNSAQDKSLTINYQIPAGSKTDINIYDRNGNKIQTLNGTASQAIWDGRNQSGELVSAGIYIVTLKSNGTLIKKKVVVTK